MTHMFCGQGQLPLLHRADIKAGSAYRMTGFGVQSSRSGTFGMGGCLQSMGGQTGHRTDC